MKNKINGFLDWFENHFNVFIDITALVGSIFTLLLAIIVFVLGIFDSIENFSFMEYIVLPGFIGFMAIIMLFALRITRHLTKNKDEL